MTYKSFLRIKADPQKIGYMFFHIFNKSQVVTCQVALFHITSVQGRNSQNFFRKFVRFLLLSDAFTMQLFMLL